MMGGALSRRSSAFFVYCLIFTSGMKEYLKLTEARACGYNRIKRRHGKKHGKNMEKDMKKAWKKYRNGG